MKTIRLTMAQALLKFLDQQYTELDGIQHKFVQGVMGIFGHGNVTGIGQALEDESELKFVQAHNEQSMVHAATAFAKQKKRLGIYACTSSIGPGALNMVTGAATATVNRIPVLLLPGDIFACRQPDPVLQQVEDPTDYSVSANDAFRPVSRYWDRVVRPEQLMTAALNAMRVLTDPVDTGAVTLCLPQDVQAEAYDYPETFFAKRVHVIDRRPLSAAACERATELIRGKQRPIIICGGGVRYSLAGDALQAFAEAFGIPIAETQAGKGVILWDHPLNVGAMGVTGSSAANALAREADLVIAVGTRLSDFTTASKSAFQNPNVSILSLNVNRFDGMKMSATSFIADAKEGLTSLTKALRDAGWRAGYREGQIRDLKAKWDAEVNRVYALTSPDGLTQTEVVGELNRLLAPSDVIVAAAGGLPGDLHRLWRCREANTYHMEYGFSCMGYEIAGTFGAKLAEPDRDVYAVVGDGSYLMLHSAIVTSLQERTKITVLLLDNSGYQCIHNLQRGHGSHSFGNELRYREASTGRLTGDYLPIDFAAHARSLGAAGFRVTTIDELRAAFAEAKQSKVTSVIDIKVLPGTGTVGYDSWWRVGVAEVSHNPDVQAAFETMKSKIDTALQL